MNIVVQLVDKKTGQRTRPITKTRQQFADQLADLYVGNGDNAYVLVLADDSVEPGSLDFALAPLMTVTSFIEHFSSKKQTNLEV